MDPLALTVASVRSLNPVVRELVLRAADGAALPAFAAGAHIRVQVQVAGAPDWREYSLIDANNGEDSAPTHYRIAVRRDDVGRGGSRYMHERVKEGDVLQVQPPKNDFPLHDHAGAAVLIAGGIGVTPLVSMAARLRAQGRPVSMHYAVRDSGLLAYQDELSALLGNNLQIHSDQQAGAPLDVAAILSRCTADEQVYVCGPRPMLDAVLARAVDLGWPPERVHFELFAPPVVEAGDQAFEVELAQSGQRFDVPANRSILDVLIDAGCDPMFDCKRGECGVCAVPVIDGEIDHRDYVLTAGERAAGNVIQICVSRAKGRRLVLDL
jgi:vanillate O-demethylase ferredoxin subunit